MSNIVFFHWGYSSGSEAIVSTVRRRDKLLELNCHYVDIRAVEHGNKSTNTKLQFSTYTGQLVAEY
jgi:hypothetical protein